MGSSTFAKEALALDEAQGTCLRNQFHIPSKQELANPNLCSDHQEAHSDIESQSTYLCGNSLGLQPTTVQSYVNDHLALWRSKGVYGHFKDVQDSLVPPWVSMDEALQAPVARIVGANRDEVAIMQTLSTNLHILLGSFYNPTAEKYKIMIEAKSFPSDHFVVESQLQHHGIGSKDGMILLEPPEQDSPLLPTKYILSQIDEHADNLALLMLPGIQFYTGQFFDIPTITAHAQAKGIVVGWDLAHAVGNVPLRLHDWNVDFAAWCNYKYVNAGPGAIGGLFVHEHKLRAPYTTQKSSITNGEAQDPKYRPRLQGWWGSTKASRFAMDNVFSPMPGAAGFQLSNPSGLDMSALLASLSVFDMTTMEVLRERSIQLTAFLERLLLTPLSNGSNDAALANGHAGTRQAEKLPFKIITPSDPAQRGAQLSLRLDPKLLDSVVKVLERESIVIDERKPDVIRVAPAPLYNTFSDCARFARVFKKACEQND